MVVIGNAREKARINKALSFSATLGRGLYPVGKWGFENNVKDSSGMSNHGTIHGNPQYVEGIVGKALDFDGNDYVDCGADPSLNITGAITIEAWVKVSSSFPAGSRIGNIIGNYPHSPNFNFEGHANGKLRFYWNSGQRDVYATDFDMRDDTWHHVVVTRNKNIDKIIFYIDGNSKGEHSAGSNADYHWPLRIGGDFRSTPGIPFHGIIDEPRIYNESLSSSQIQQHYAEGLKRLLAKGEISREEYEEKISVSSIVTIEP